MLKDTINKMCASSRKMVNVYIVIKCNVCVIWIQKVDEKDEKLKYDKLKTYKCSYVFEYDLRVISISSECSNMILWIMKYFTVNDNL